MRKLFTIVLSFILVGCVKQSTLALYAFNEKTNNKALNYGSTILIPNENDMFSKTLRSCKKKNGNIFIRINYLKLKSIY